MHKVSLKKRLRYQLDKLISRGAGVMVLGLILCSAALISLISVGVYLSDIVPDINGKHPHLIDIFWYSLMRTLDGGTMGMDTGSWPFLLCMLLITLAGILFISTLTGIVTAGIQNKMATLRKGHTFVVEHDHTVILGWSPQIFKILEELFFANQNDPRFRVVILADHDKVDMEDDIQFKLGKRLSKRVVCRSGDPMDLQALDIVNLHGSRAIIILTPEHSVDPDSDVIKTILAVTNNPDRSPEPYHIVAAVRSANNLSVAKMVGQHEVEIVLTESLIARLSVQACRQAGLSLLYQDILDFQGNNILFKAEPQLVGKRFKEAALAFENSILLGIRESGGTIHLNPPFDQVIQAEDILIILSLDLPSIKLASAPPLPFEPAALAPIKPKCLVPTRTLILGWNHNTPNVINELDAYVAPGSQVHVIAEKGVSEAAIVSRCVELKHLDYSFEIADTTQRDVLERVHAENFDYVMAMAYSDRLETQKADAKTLLTLLHLRDLANHSQKNVSLAAEMLDARNSDLAKIAQVNDFIVSDKFISLIMAQLAQNKELNQIFEELLSPEGVEIYLKPAEDYITLSHPVHFYTVMEAAFARDELAIGYKLKRFEKDPNRNHGIFLNPDKTEYLSFSADDRLIVIAED